MTRHKSVALRNAQLDAWETYIGASPILKIRTGDQPAAITDASTGTILATATLPADFMNNAASGQKTLLGTWQDSSADNSGRAGHYEIYKSDGTTLCERGDVGENWVASKAYSLGDHVVNDSGKLYKCTTAGTTAGSGGPTGTGSSITDNTAVWQYIGLVDMVVDSIVFNAGQSFTVTSYTITGGNA